MDPLFLSIDEISGRERLGIGRGHATGDIRRRIPPRFDPGDGSNVPVAYLPNHPFIDGNKRTAANAAITFLLMNNWEPAFDEDQLVEIVLSVAEGKMLKPELSQTFASQCHLL
jgi:hypothetical protein